MDILRRLIILAENNHMDFSIVRMPIASPHWGIFVIKVGKLEFFADMVDERSLFDALVFFTAKIEHKAEVIDF